MGTLYCFLVLALASLVQAQGRHNVAALANGATCTTDSVLDQTTTCDKALDSIEDPENSQWATLRDGVGAHINITLPGLREVDEIRLLQRCDMFDMTKTVIVAMDGGTAHQLALSCDGGGASGTDCDGIVWERFPIAPVTTSSIKITLSEVCNGGGFYGLREVVVMGREINTDDGVANLATKHQGGTCESSSDWSELYQCHNAIDGVIDTNPEVCWVSASGEHVGSWLKISLPSNSKISKLRMKNRCALRYEMSTVMVDFDGGFSQLVSLTCHDGTTVHDCAGQVWDEVEVPNIITSSINITGTEACDPNPVASGFQEVEIWGRAEGDQLCPFDFTEVPSLSSCYKFVEQRVNITQAKADCSSLHPLAHLVEINSDAEQDYLYRTAEEMRNEGIACDFFTNGHQVSGEWYWESTGKKIVFPDWGANYPSPTEGYDFIILALNLFKFVNVPGANIHCYVCEV